MKKILRFWFINIIGLNFIASFLTTIEFSNGWQTVILVALALTFFELALKPIIKILLLPINILTLGLARSVINLIGLYAITLIVPGFLIRPYLFPGLHENGFSIPEVQLSMIWTYILVSVLLNLSFSIIRWIVKK